MLKVGIALIGPSGTGKTTIGKLLAKRLNMEFHDMDDDGLEWVWGKDGVARMLLEKWDDGFLDAEGNFVMENYGRKEEQKTYTLTHMIFSASGSLVLEEDAIRYMRDRMLILYLDLEDREIERRATLRWITRIVGMNGENPRFRSIGEVLAYRRSFYEKYADLIYPLSPWASPEEDAERIASFIEKYGWDSFSPPSLLSDSRSAENLSLPQAIITSQPLSWGLWCPTVFPQISLLEIEKLRGLRYDEVAKKVLGKWSFGIEQKALDEIIEEAYGSQWHHEDITPMKHITENLYSLHLWYGPTFAFKNIALEFLPRLLSRLTKGKIVHVLWASSGDTINAAHSGVKGTNIRSIFMLPAIGPSVVQRLQAVHGIAENPNAFTLLADAPFDPLQDIVKKINSSQYREFKEKYRITSFNSINIARILAQTVYYFRAYAKLLEQGVISLWEKISFSVPSGNFWDALAGYYALKMWLPIDRINIATNENDMLHIFFETGRYAPPKKDGKDSVTVTNAPSMDIAKSSNFERMLYDIIRCENEQIARWYYDLSQCGEFQVDKDTLAKIRNIFTSSRSTDDERIEAIRRFSEEYQHGIDPHTASAVTAWLRESSHAKMPLVFLETSHVAQFTKELESQGISVPWMHTFDDFLAKVEDAHIEEWVQYFYTGWDFEAIFPFIEDILEHIFPQRFSP